METTYQKSAETKAPKNNTMEKWAIVTGIIMCICYIIYFLIMESMGLADVPEYRILNLVIQVTAIAVSIKLYKTAAKGNFSYLEGFAIGCFSSFVSVILFAGFMYVYLLKINPQLLAALMNSSSMLGKYATPFSAAITITIEGCISGLLISFACMQLFKDDALHNPLKKKSDEVE